VRKLHTYGKKDKFVLFRNWLPNGHPDRSHSHVNSEYIKAYHGIFFQQGKKVSCQSFLCLNHWKLEETSCLRGVGPSSCTEVPAHVKGIDFHWWILICS